MFEQPTQLSSVNPLQALSNGPTVYSITPKIAPGIKQTISISNKFNDLQDEDNDSEAEDEVKNSKKTKLGELNLI